MTNNGDTPKKKTRILNLNDFLPPDIGIMYNGTYHQVLPINTEIWLRMLQQNQKLISQVQRSKKGETADMLAQQELEMLGTINMLCEVCPTLPREELMAMPLIPLQKFSQMVMEAMNDEMEDAASGETPGELTSSL